MRKTFAPAAAALLALALLVTPAGACGYGGAVAAFAPGYSFNFFPAVSLTYAYAYPVLPVVPVVPAPVPPPAAVGAAPAAVPATMPPAADPGVGYNAVPAGTYGVAPAALAAGYTPAVATFAAVGTLPVYYRAGFGYSLFNTRFNRFVSVGYGSFTNVARVGGFHAAAFASAGFAGQQMVVGGRGRAVVAQNGVGGFGQQAVVSGGRRGANVVAQQSGGGAGQQVVVSQRGGLLGRRQTNVVVQQGGGVGGAGQQAVISGRTGRRR